MVLRNKKNMCIIEGRQRGIHTRPNPNQRLRGRGLRCSIDLRIAVGGRHHRGKLFKVEPRNRNIVNAVRTEPLTSLTRIGMKLSVPKGSGMRSLI